MLLTMLLASTPLTLMPAAPKRAAGADVAVLATSALIVAAEIAEMETAPPASTSEPVA